MAQIKLIELIEKSLIGKHFVNTSSMYTQKVYRFDKISVSTSWESSNRSGEEESLGPTFPIHSREIWVEVTYLGTYKDPSSAKKQSVLDEIANNPEATEEEVEKGNKYEYSRHF